MSSVGIKRDPGRSSTFTLHHAHLKKAILLHKRALVKTEVVTTVISSVSATNKEESTSIWNKENVQVELKKWLKDVQTSQQSATE